MFALSPTLADLASLFQQLDDPSASAYKLQQFLGQAMGLPVSDKKIIKHNSKKNLRGLSGLGRFFVANVFALLYFIEEPSAH